jgi:methanethiol S-methyltransferase
MTDPRIARLVRLIGAALNPPPGASRIALALAFGVVCHVVFGVAVLSMIAAMYFGLSESFGTVPWPWALIANAALILQFPLAHL